MYFLVIFSEKFGRRCWYFHVYLRGYCTPDPYFWRLCAFSQKNRQLWTKYPMDLVRNVPRNSKITVLLQLRPLLCSYSEKCATIDIFYVLSHKSITTWQWNSNALIRFLGMLPIRNMSYLLPMCCSFWEKCINSQKTGQGCSTPLIRGLCTYNWFFWNSSIDHFGTSLWDISHNVNWFEANIRVLALFRRHRRTLIWNTRILASNQDTLWDKIKWSIGFFSQISQNAPSC